MKFFVVFDKETGKVLRTGECQDMDIDKQLFADNEDLVETARSLGPNRCRVDPATKWVEEVPYERPLRIPQLAVKPDA